MTERNDVRGLAPARAAIWTGLSDFISREEAVALLELGFCQIFFLISFFFFSLSFLGHNLESFTESRDRQQQLLEKL